MAITGEQLLGVAAVISSMTASAVAWRTGKNVMKVDEKVDKVDIQTNSHLTELSRKLDAMTTERDEITGQRDEARRALETRPEEL